MAVISLDEVASGLSSMDNMLFIAERGGIRDELDGTLWSFELLYFFFD